MEDPSQEVRRILSNNTVQEALDYLASISRTIDESSSSIKAVIGNSYKDLITACDRVMGMERTCQELLHLKEFLQEANAKAMASSSSSPSPPLSPSAAHGKWASPGAAGAAALPKKGSLGDIVSLLDFVDTKRKRKPRRHGGAGEGEQEGEGEPTHGDGGRDVGGAAEAFASRRDDRADGERHRVSHDTTATTTTSTTTAVATTMNAMRCVASPASARENLFLHLQQQFLSLEGLLAADKLVAAARVLSSISDHIAQAKRSGDRGSPPRPRGLGVPHEGEECPSSPPRQSTGDGRAGKDTEGRDPAGEAVYWADVEVTRDSYVRQTLERIRASVRADANALVLFTVSAAFDALSSDKQQQRRPGTTTTSSSSRADKKGEAGGDDFPGEGCLSLPGERTAYEQQEVVLEKLKEAAVDRFQDYHRALVLLRPSREAISRVFGVSASPDKPPAEAAKGEGGGDEDLADLRGFASVAVGQHWAMRPLPEELFSLSLPPRPSAAIVLATLVESVVGETAEACKAVLRARRHHRHRGDGEQVGAGGDGEHGMRAAMALREVLQLPSFLFKATAATTGASGLAPLAHEEEATPALATRAGAAPGRRRSGAPNPTAASSPQVESVNDSYFALHVSVQAMVLCRTLGTFLARMDVDALQAPHQQRRTTTATTAVADGESAEGLTWQDLLEAKSAFFFFGESRGGGGTATGIDGSADGEAYMSLSPEKGPVPVGSATPSPPGIHRSSVISSYLTPEKNLLRAALSSGYPSPQQPRHDIEGGDPKNPRSPSPHHPAGGDYGGGGAGVDMMEAAAPLFLSEAAKRQRRRAFTRFMLGAVSELSATAATEYDNEEQASRAEGKGMTAELLSSLRRDWQTFQANTVEPVVVAIMESFCADPMAIAAFAVAAQALLAESAGSSEGSAAHAEVLAVLEERVVVAGLRRTVDVGVAAASSALRRYLDSLQSQTTTATTVAASTGAPTQRLMGVLPSVGDGEGQTQVGAAHYFPITNAVLSLLLVQQSGATSPTARGSPTTTTTTGMSGEKRRSVLQQLLLPSSSSGDVEEEEGGRGGGGKGGGRSTASLLPFFAFGGAGDRDSEGSGGVNSGSDNGRSVPSLVADHECYPARFFAADCSPVEEAEGNEEEDSAGSDSAGGEESSRLRCLTHRKKRFYETFGQLVRAVCRLPHLFHVSGGGGGARSQDALAQELMTPLLSWMRTAAEQLAKSEAGISSALADMGGRDNDKNKADEGTRVVLVAQSCELSLMAHRLLTALTDIASSQLQQQTMDGALTRLKEAETALAAVRTRCRTQWHHVLSSEYQSGLLAVYQSAIIASSSLTPSGTEEGTGTAATAAVAEAGSSGIGSMGVATADHRVQRFPKASPKLRTLYRLQNTLHWRRVDTPALADPAKPAATSPPSLPPAALAHAVYAPVHLTSALSVLLFELQFVLLSLHANLVRHEAEARASRATVARAPATASAASNLSDDIMRSCYAMLSTVTLDTFGTNVVRLLSQESTATSTTAGTDASGVTNVPGQGSPSVPQDVWLQLYLDADVVTRLWLSSLETVPPPQAPDAVSHHQQQQRHFEKKRDELLAFFASHYDPVAWRSAALANALAAHATSLLRSTSLGFGFPSSTSLFSSSSPTLPARAAPSIPLAVRPLHEVERFSLLPIASSTSAVAGMTGGPSVLSNMRSGGGHGMSAGAGAGGVAVLNPTSAAAAKLLQQQQQQQERYDSSSTARGGRGGNNANALASALWGTTQRGWNSLWGQEEQQQQQQQQQQQKGQQRPAVDDDAYFFGTV